MSRRRAGVLLHPTSLPYSVMEGSLGEPAIKWLDFLATAGFTVWQVLPLVPPDMVGSPYQSCSVFAGNPMMVGLKDLYQWGLLRETDENLKNRETQLREAASRFNKHAPQEVVNELDHFSSQCEFWLEDYVLFQTLHDHFELPWHQWPEPFRDRDTATLRDFSRQHEDDMFRHRLTQFLFWRQWHALKRVANDKGIWLFGDMPIFAAHDSVDTWRWRQNFYLDSTGRMTRIAAVPPDCFSDSGQLWNMPHYNWPQMQDNQYHWWQQRLHYQLHLFDLIRIDHFRGFEAAYGVQPDSKDATRGEWYAGPGIEFFHTIGGQQVVERLVAEDLGYITEEVNQLRLSLGIPGMRVLQFAFDNDGYNPHLSHYHCPNMVVYTGTHDNNTTVGWWQDADADLKERAKEYLCGSCTLMPDTLISVALGSVANLVILPLQDILALGSEARMNKPGCIENNWQWQFSSADLTGPLAQKYRALLSRYARL